MKKWNEIVLEANKADIEENAEYTTKELEGMYNFTISFLKRAVPANASDTDRSSKALKNQKILKFIYWIHEQKNKKGTLESIVNSLNSSRENDHSLKEAMYSLDIKI